MRSTGAAIPSMVRKPYAQAVRELQDSLDEADQQAGVDPLAAGYPRADELTPAQLAREWLCRRGEQLILTDLPSR